MRGGMMTDTGTGRATRTGTLMWCHRCCRMSDGGRRMSDVGAAADAAADAASCCVCVSVNSVSPNFVTSMAHIWMMPSLWRWRQLHSGRCNMRVNVSRRGAWAWDGDGMGWDGMEWKVVLTCAMHVESYMHEDDRVTRCMVLVCHMLLVLSDMAPDIVVPTRSPTATSAWSNNNNNNNTTNSINIASSRPRINLSALAPVLSEAVHSKRVTRNDAPHRSEWRSDASNGDINKQMQALAQIQAQQQKHATTSATSAASATSATKQARSPTHAPSLRDVQQQQALEQDIPIPARANIWQTAHKHRSEPRTQAIITPTATSPSISSDVMLPQHAAELAIQIPSTCYAERLPLYDDHDEAEVCNGCDGAPLAREWVGGWMGGWGCGEGRAFSFVCS